MEYSAFKKWWLKKGSPGQKKTYQMYRKRCNGKPELKFLDIIDYTKRAKKETENNGFYDDSTFLKFLEKGETKENLCNYFNVDLQTFLDRIKVLKKSFNIVDIGDIIKLEKNIVIKNNKYSLDLNGESKVIFGVTSDNHFCNKLQQLTFLKSFYRLCKERGAKRVFNAGDVTEGHFKRRPDHIYEIMGGKIGVDDQADYVAEVYPYEEGIITDVIGGNHDETHIQNGGADVLKRVANQRNDFNYLGNGSATIQITKNCSVRLIHPLDGATYALSYSAQKYVDSIQGGEKPDILLIGHHHKAMYLFYRNIHILECGTTCGQTLWMERKRIAAHTGAWIVEVTFDKEGKILRFLPEFIPLYKMVKEDY